MHAAKVVRANAIDRRDASFVRVSTITEQHASH